MVFLKSGISSVIDRDQISGLGTQPLPKLARTVCLTILYDTPMSDIFSPFRYR